MGDRWFKVVANFDGPKFKKTNIEIEMAGIECSEAELLGILCMIWSFGSLGNAEKDGHLAYVREKDLANYIRYKNSRSKIDSDTMIALLIENKWIDVIDGELFIHNWSSYQDHWYKYVDKLEKDAERKRESRRNKKSSEGSDESGRKQQISLLEDGAGGTESDDCHSESTNDTEDEKHTNKQEQKKKNDTEYPTGFEEFWKVYPRHADKGQCYAKYKARLNDGFSPDELLSAAINYANQCKRQKTDAKFIKHGKTFLGDSTPFIEFIPKKPVENNQIPDDSNPFAQFGGDE